MTKQSIISPGSTLWSTTPCCTTLQTNITATAVPLSLVDPKWLPTLPPLPAIVSVPEPLWPNWAKVLRLLIHLRPVWCQGMRVLCRQDCHWESHHHQDTSMLKLKGKLEAEWSQATSIWPTSALAEEIMRNGLQRKSQSNKRTSAVLTWRMVSITVIYCVPNSVFATSFFTFFTSLLLSLLSPI